MAGAVQATNTVAAPGGGQLGVHVSLQPADGGDALDVHLGPQWYLEEIGLEPLVGDDLGVVGAKDGTMLVAREVRRGDQRWSLRESDGRPKWRRRGGRT